MDEELKKIRDLIFSDDYLTSELGLNLLVNNRENYVDEYIGFFNVNAKIGSFL